MPTLVLLAGPNGAGKTTFINRFLRQRAEAFRFVNPDEVARGLTGEGRARDLAAGRLVLERLDALFSSGPTWCWRRPWPPAPTPRVSAGSGRPATGSN